MKDKIIVIVGPTAVGKTQLGITLAKAFNGEVINGDSMQVYKQLDIGTAKVREQEADEVAHHLIDIKSPEESYSVSDFKKDAREKIHELIEQEKLPIIVGGTGLYIESLLYDVTHGGKAEPNEAFRDKMNRFAHEKGREALHQLLRDKDLKAAENIHPNNVRRVIRALEVMHETGKKFSDHQNERKKEPVFDAYVIALNTDREVLYERINHRVDLMLGKGLLEEARWLYETYEGDLQSKKGIGYKEFDAYLRGDQSYEEAVKMIKQHSRNYAKRQLTWFKNRFSVNQWTDLVERPEELETIKNNIQNFIEGDYMDKEKVYEKVIIVGIEKQHEEEAFNYSFDELEQLVENAGGKVVARLSQKRERPDHKTVIGKGKVNELKNLVEELDAQTVVFNLELSPSHVRNIQEVIDTKVIDRIQVILDIFALRAKSKEGRLQVELAQLSYILPRLAGQGVNMSRLGAGIGTRGPGETKLETDRRHIQSQMSDIKHELKKYAAHRKRSREKRKNNNIYQIGLIGYTNAGKSTVLNQLTEADTYEKDQLFATLDPLTRKFELPRGMQVTMTDTVGFIQELPTQLIEAFKSTLEESMDVDLLLHVIDASADNLKAHEQTVLSLLKELGMDEIPTLHVYNKRDLVKGPVPSTLYPNIVISAQDANDVEALRKKLESEMKKTLKPYQLEIESHRGDLLIELRQQTLLERQLFDEENQVYFVEGYAKEESKWLTM